MAEPSVLQTGGPAGNASDTITITGVTAGSTLVAIGCQGASDIRTYSFSDDQANTWTNLTTYTSANNRRVVAGYAFDVAAGTTIINCNPDPLNSLSTWVVYEVSNAGVVDVAFNTEDQPNESSHDLYTGGVALSNDSIMFFGIAVDAATTFGATGYTTSFDAGTSQGFHGYQVFASGAAGEAVTVTDSSSRDGGSVCFALKDSGGGGGPTHPYTSITVTG